MVETGGHFDSVRLSRRESRRLTLALALSLAAHLLAWGGYEVGKELDWWQRLHWPAWLHHAAKKLEPLQPVVQNVEPPLMFVDVNPDQAATEAPKNAKYYSDKSSRAANPDANHDTDTPQINGRQTDVVKTENVPRPNFNKLQPSRPTPQAEETQEAPPKQLQPGDLTVGKPEDLPSENDSTQERPRTLKEALAQQNRLPGQQMKQDGGARREALVLSLDVQATPFGAYDAALVDAVQSRWYGLLDSQQFALDRSGKVTLRFHLNYDGRITDMKVLENTVGDLLGYVCQKAVTDPAPFAPWPSDMRRMVSMDYREITFTFYYY